MFASCRWLRLDDFTGLEDESEKSATGEEVKLVRRFLAGLDVSSTRTWAVDLAGEEDEVGVKVRRVCFLRCDFRSSDIAWTMSDTMDRLGSKKIT